MKIPEEKCESKEECLEPLGTQDINTLLKEIPGWELKEKHLERMYKFQDFQGSMDFVNKVAQIAQEQDHHPDIGIHYNKVLLTLFTHKKNALTKNDFIVAAKINRIAP